MWTNIEDHPCTAFLLIACHFSLLGKPVKVGIIAFYALRDHLRFEVLCDCVHYNTTHQDSEVEEAIRGSCQLL